MQTSAAGRKALEDREGCELRAYPDVEGVWTIGYGNTGDNVGPDTVWTQEQADAALTYRLAHEFEPAVNKVVEDALTTQNQYDAMVSLAYNIGANAFAHSMVARKHAEEDYQAAADAFLNWNKPAVLIRRRKAERAQYLTP